MKTRQNEGFAIFQIETDTADITLFNEDEFIFLFSVFISRQFFCDKRY